MSLLHSALTELSRLSILNDYLVPKTYTSTPIIIGKNPIFGIFSKSRHFLAWALGKAKTWVYVGFTFSQAFFLAQKEQYRPTIMISRNKLNIDHFGPF